MFNSKRDSGDSASLDGAPAPRSKIGFNLNIFGPYFLGMTAPQRFIVSIMLLFIVCIIGLLFLLVTQTIVPPF
jgi:hypothetical protein